MTTCRTRCWPTWTETADNVALAGGVPVRARLDEALSERYAPAAFEAAVTPRTRAIVPVHYAGVGCEMNAIMDIAQRYGVVVVEDNAHGLFGKYRGQYLGTFGALATGLVDVAPLVSRAYPLKDLAKALGDVKDRVGNPMKPVVVP